MDFILSGCIRIKDVYGGSHVADAIISSFRAAELRFDKRLIIDVGDYRRLNGVIAGLMGD